MKVTIKNWRNATPSVGELNQGLDLTVPDQTLPLKTLLERYVRGENVVQFNPQYDADTDLPDLTGMSAMDQLDLSRQIQDDIQGIRSRLKPEKSVPKPRAEPDDAQFEDVPAS